MLLLNAGHEASVNGFGNGMAALFRNPDQLARLVADPWGTAPTAVEEMLRYDAPLQLFERTAKEDVEVAGVQLREGEKIAALLGSANRDPEVFAAADAMDVGRDPNPHLGFGAGHPLLPRARRWPGSSCRPPCRCCSSASRTCGRPATRSCARPSSCAATRPSPSPSPLTRGRS